jgi:hypothetical protein
LPSLGFKSALLITIASSILGGINLLFLSFITQLIFECRNYLKEIFDSKTKIRYHNMKLILSIFIIASFNLFSADFIFVEVEEKMVGENIHKTHAEKQLERFPTSLSV